MVINYAIVTMFCDICGDQGKPEYQNLNKKLRIYFIAQQFTDYWLHGRLPTMIEARNIIESCHCMFNEREFEDFHNLFKMDIDDIDGYKLFKLSEGTFKSAKTWELLIIIFALAAEMINIKTCNLIAQWLEHVLVQNDIWM